jgi:enoyl-CoA hydratase
LTIHYAKNDEHIVLITIDRPERKNALDLPHWRDLSDAWKRYRDDPDAWVAIVTGVDGCFCAGADLGDFISKVQQQEGGKSIDLNNLADFEVDGISLKAALEGTLRDLAIYKPIIAAVNGPAVAGGIELLGGVDIVVASTEAVFGVLEPKRGLFAGGGTTPRLPRQIGWRASMELLLCADKIPAERALQLGLVNEVVPADQLMDRAYDYAHRIAANAPISVRATKESALRGLAAGSMAEAYLIEAEVVKMVAESEDSVEGTRAFLEKRPPVWQGR